MKAIIGTAIGVFAIGLVLVGAGLRLSTGAQASPASNVPVLTSLSNAPAMAVAGAAMAPTASGAVVINCSPGQRAMVRPVSMNGETVSQVACVDDGFAPATAPDAVRAVPIAQRVSYRTPRRAASVERRVVYQEPAPTRVAPERSWKKRLLVIGGSTAAGAGVGGLVGGKKGALIGAALGGGASTLFEATKR